MGKSGKGSSWEREICKFLSKWIQGEEKPYLFWRGRGSGSTFTKDDLVGESFAGDIYPVRDEGKWLLNYFVIECKNGYPKASIDKHLKYNKNDDIYDFWLQVNSDCKKVKKSPMLVYRKKGQNPWLGINKHTKNLLIDKNLNMRYILIHWEDEIDDLYLYDFYKFFEEIDCKKMEKLLCID